MTPLEKQTKKQTEEVLKRERSAAKLKTEEANARFAARTNLVQELSQAFGSVDLDGDNVLDRRELTELSAEHFRALGVSGVDQLLMQYDTDGSGELDVFEKRQLMAQMVPVLSKEASSLEREGEFLGATALRNNIKSLKKLMHEDHMHGLAREAAVQRSATERAVDIDWAVFTDDWERKWAENERHFAERHAVADRILSQKLHTLIRQQPDKPCGPRTPKYKPAYYALKKQLQILARVRHPTEDDLAKAEQLQKELRKLEEDGLVAHAMRIPQYMSQRERQLRAEHAKELYKIETALLKSRQALRHEYSTAEARLENRHRGYEAKEKHSHTLMMSKPVVDGLRKVRPWPKLPNIPGHDITMYKPCWERPLSAQGDAGMPAEPDRAETPAPTLRRPSTATGWHPLSKQASASRVELAPEASALSGVFRPPSRPPSRNAPQSDGTVCVSPTKPVPAFMLRSQGGDRIIRSGSPYFNVDG